jgi:hypothetical protein
MTKKFVRTASNDRTSNANVYPRSQNAIRLAVLLMVLAAVVTAQSGTWSNVTEYPVPTLNSHLLGSRRGPMARCGSPNMAAAGSGASARPG